MSHRAAHRILAEELRTAYTDLVILLVIGVVGAYWKYCLALGVGWLLYQSLKSRLDL